MILRPEQILLLRLGLPPVPLNEDGGGEFQTPVPEADMSTIRGRLAAIGLPQRNIDQIAPVLEQLDPSGTTYTEDVLRQVQQQQTSRFGAWSGNEDSNDILRKIVGATGGTEDDQRAAQIQASPTGAAWNQEGQSLWSESQKSSGGLFGGDFGSLLSIGLPFALTAFGLPPALTAALGGGTLGSIGAGALIGAGTSLLTGGNPIKGGLFGAAGGAIGSAVGGAAAEAGGAGLSGGDLAAFNGDVAAVPANIESAIGANGAAAPSAIDAGSFGGTPTNGQSFMVAQAGTSDVPQGLFEKAGVDSADLPGDVHADPTNIDAAIAANGEPSQFGVDSVVNGDVHAVPGNIDAAIAANGTPTTGANKGVIGRAIDWARTNKDIVVPGAQLIFGAMKGAGDRQNAMDLQRMKQEGDAAMIERKKQADMDLQRWKRQFAQAGSYFDAPLAISAGSNTLRRPDGTPVYQNGIITNAMKA